MRLRALTALTTLLAFLVTLVWPHGVEAQSPPPATAPPPSAAPAPAPDDASMAQAKQRFEAGKNAYNAGDYAGAIREFKAAEQLRPSPILDYNIGLANEKLNKKRVAVKYYRRYLNLQPNAKNKDEVDQRINALESQIAQEPPPATTATPGGNAPQPEQAGDMPPADTTGAQPAPPAGYDPYSSPPPPGYAMQPQPIKKKKSLWWLGIVIPGAVLLLIVLPIVLYVTLAAPTVTTFDHAPNAERLDAHAAGGLTLFRF